MKLLTMNKALKGSLCQHKDGVNSYVRRVNLVWNGCKMSSFLQAQCFSLLPILPVILRWTRCEWKCGHQKNPPCSKSSSDSQTAPSCPFHQRCCEWKGEKVGVWVCCGWVYGGGEYSSWMGGHMIWWCIYIVVNGWMGRSLRVFGHLFISWGIRWRAGGCALVAWAVRPGWLEMTTYLHLDGNEGGLLAATRPPKLFKKHKIKAMVKLNP